MLKSLRGVDTKNTETSLECISIVRHNTDTVCFMLASDDLIFLIIPIELLRQLEQIRANVMRLKCLSCMCNDFMIFT